MDPPIYLCENPQSHSVCSSCHESLIKERKPCPVCRQGMKSKRNVTLEGMVENIPNKTKCKFNGCDYKRSDAETVKKHEDVCDNRYVPCVKCNDEKISLKGLAQHVVNKHYNGVEFKADSFGHAQSILQNAWKAAQAVISVGGDGHKYLFNWCSLDDDFTLFWYTLQVYRNKENTEKYAFEGTRDCIPCDLSHSDVKKKKCTLVLDKGLIADATKDDGKFRYFLTIDES